MATVDCRCREPKHLSMLCEWIVADRIQISTGLAIYLRGIATTETKPNDYQPLDTANRRMAFEFRPGGLNGT